MSRWPRVRSSSPLNSFYSYFVFIATVPLLLHCICLFFSNCTGPVTPDHALILPIAHLPVSTQLPASAKAEVQRYKAALRQYLASTRQVAVFFERSVPTKGVQHMHVQCLPLPAEAASTIVDAFRVHASKIGLTLLDIPADQADNQDQVCGNLVLVAL
jgi:hypothetical protein